MSKCVVILSGGLDSTTLLYDVIASKKFSKVYALSFNYGQNHTKELECAKKTCEKLAVEQKTVDMEFLGKELLFGSSLTTGSENIPEGNYNDDNMKQTVVPNRNMILIALAGGYAISVGAETLFYGAHGGDHEIYPDCRPEFVKAMQNVLSICDWHTLKLEAPYIDYTKGDIAARGKELGVDYSLTWTCYKGGEKACGKCGSCRERLEAFEQAGFKDPVEYEEE